MDAGTKNIVFDWNGTLLDDTDAIRTCLNVILAQAGRGPVDMDTYREQYEVPFEKFYVNFGMTAEEIEKSGIVKNNVFHDHYEPMADKAPLRDGSAEILVLTHGSGIRNVILSNHIVDPIRTQLKRLAVDHLFSDVLAYASRATQFRDMTKGERLKRFMQERRAIPEQTIIIGDSIEEIEIARELGLIGIGITGGSVSERRLRAANPHHVVHSLHELKAILQERGFVS